MINVVYLITCTKCRKQYVVETSDHVNQRMNGHRDEWKQKRFEKFPIAEHFCSSEHDFLNHASLCCFTLRPHSINKAMNRGNYRSLVSTCDNAYVERCVYVTFFPDSQRKSDLFFPSIDQKPSALRISLAYCIHSVYRHNSVDKT